MHSVEFIQDLTVVLLVAGIVTLLFRRLKQPVVLGYILAGLIIGPHTPPFELIHDEEIIKTLAHLGVIFLMFSMGLHFSLRKLKEVGVTALIASLFEILLMLLIGYEVGIHFGWSEMDSVFLGAILSISSTTIILKALQELGRSQEHFAQLMLGILIMEDILAIALLTLLSSIALTGVFNVGDVLHTFSRLGIFLTIILILGLIAVPALLNYVAKLNNKEMLLITVLALCFGVSLTAVKLGYSDALGAFLIGAVMAESREHGLIEELIGPLRDLFSAIFFVSVGLLIDPKLLVQYAWPITLITLAVVFGKILTCSFGTFVAGNDVKTSVRVGLGLAQIGEFSFIIASLGLSLNVTSAFLYPIAVMVSVVTTLLTPYLMRSSDTVLKIWDQVAPKTLQAWLDYYTQWVQKIMQHREPTAIKKQIRKNLGSIAVNMVFVSGIFISVDYIADHWIQWGERVPAWLGNPASISWFIAMFLSLPFLATSLFKLKAMGMSIVELSTSEKSSSKARKITAAVIPNTLVLAGALIIGLWILYMSTTLYTPRSSMIGMLVLLGIFLILFWKLFIQLYGKLQENLEDSLKPHAESHS